MLDVDRVYPKMRTLEIKGTRDMSSLGSTGQQLKVLRSIVGDNTHLQWHQLLSLKVPWPNTSSLPYCSVSK